MSTARVALCSLALAGVVALAACGSDDDGVGATTTTAAATSSAGSTPAAGSTSAAGSTPSAGELELENTTWTLSADTDLGVDLAGVDVSAQFVDGTVSGTSGCNRYSGRYTLDGDDLTIDPNVAGTMMACPAAQMAVESAFLQALPTVATWAIDGETLTLSDDAGKAVLVFDHVDGEQAIAGDWQVTAVNTGSAISSPILGSTLTLTFAPGTASGNAGCNTFSGAAVVDGEQLTIGPLASTRMACTDQALSDQEAAYLAALENTTTFSGTSSMLTLLDDEGLITVTLARA